MYKISIIIKPKQHHTHESARVNALYTNFNVKIHLKNVIQTKESNSQTIKIFHKNISFYVDTPFEFSLF